ncbi:hypothetical protein U1Q18_029745 [Sarracenia purpurea var. burkii]
MKRKVQPVQFLKKLRSKLSRRRRLEFFTIPCSDAITSPIPFPVDSCASSKLTGEVSCDSSRISVTKPRPSPKKKDLEEISGLGKSEEFRRVTRSYYRQRENERKEEEKRGVGDGEVKLLEFSCAESCSGVDTPERSSRLKRKSAEADENVKEFEGIEDSQANTKSEVSCVKQFSGEVSRKIIKSEGEKGKGTENSLGVKENEVPLFSAKANKNGGNRAFRVELSEASGNYGAANLTISNSESTVEQKPNLSAKDSDLACLEHICFEDVSDSSAFSDLRSEIFHVSSDLDFSDCTASTRFESGSEFSERSVNDTSPSPTFSLFIQYSQQFSRSISSPDSKISSRLEDEQSDEIKSSRFEDDEHEMSYQMLRKRERRQVYLHDYAEEYCSTAEHGELIIQQRLQMVHWIVEVSCSRAMFAFFLAVDAIIHFESVRAIFCRSGLQ